MSRLLYSAAIRLGILRGKNRVVVAAREHPQSISMTTKLLIFLSVAIALVNYAPSVHQAINGGAVVIRWGSRTNRLGGAFDDGSGLQARGGEANDPPGWQLKEESSAKNQGGKVTEVMLDIDSVEGMDRAEAMTAIAAAHAVSAAIAAPMSRVCTDTCVTARNGVCNEGRRLTGLEVPEGQHDPEVYTATCDLGTDCADCGEWLSSGTAEALEWRPVQDLRSKDLPVFVRQTKTPTGFWMAYTDPKLDTDVSEQMHSSAVVDKHHSIFWHRILKKNCVGPNGERRLVLDVGANFGYFSLLAASMGCRVVAWEPVPHHASLFKYNLQRNNLTARVEVREKLVTDDAGAMLRILAPRHGPWRVAGINGYKIDKATLHAEDVDRVELPAERIDMAVQEDVFIMKVHAAGFEPFAIKSASAILDNFKIDNIIFGYDPGAAERHAENEGEWGIYEANPATLARLLNSGYQVVSLEGLQGVQDWDAPLPALETVTKEVIKYDLEDAYRLYEGKLGCPMPESLAKWLWGCNELPLGLHPYSFRATFGSSTILWAGKQGTASLSVVQAGSPASLFPPNTDLRKFFSPHGLGTGRRPCSQLNSTEQIRHRCHCTQSSACGELEQLVNRLAAEGRLPPVEPPARVAKVESLTFNDWLG